MSALALVMVTGITFNPAFVRFFSLRVSQLLGKLSFPLYLTHVQVFASVSCLAFLALFGAGASRETAAAIVIVLSIPAFLLAAALFYPVEWLAVHASRALSSALLGRTRTVRA
jgi:peptidoglycan/LPS O-acetylase OafA/YrhL